ncbi:uncharacterized protein [Nicotiana tomentosiformis]|uniref:uncharacterized protein n=1 Tax=Nicotiana tomentosiformis TaxID=4098 RepID=UPI00388CAFDA
MSMTCTISASTGGTFAFGGLAMAIHEIEDGHSRSLPQGPCKDIACGNGPHFIDSKVTKFLEGLKIKRIASSPYHPTSNGQAESTNKVIIQDLKKKLEDAKGKWPDDLLGVLWAYRTTAKLRTGETPFSLVYGSEALMLVEVGEPTLRFSRANKEKNNEVFLVKLDLLEEHWDLEYMRMVA